MQNSYIDDVIMSRRLMNNMVNLMNHQERNIRLIINQRSSISQGNQYSYFINGSDRVNPNRQNNVNTAPIGPTTRRTNRPQSARSPNIETTRVNTPVIQFSNLFTPSRVTNRRSDIPTALEIHNATRSNTYSNIVSPPNNVCPITRETFNADDEVTQIVQCGHVFTRNNLYQWFNRSSVCPMCRYDIRNSSTSNTEENTRTSNTNTRNSTSGNNTRINREENLLNNNIELTNIAEQIATDILNNITDSPSISLEYTLQSPTEINSTNTIDNNNTMNNNTMNNNTMNNNTLNNNTLNNNTLTHRTTYDASFSSY